MDKDLLIKEYKHYLDCAIEAMRIAARHLPYIDPSIGDLADTIEKNHGT